MAAVLSTARDTGTQPATGPAGEAHEPAYDVVVVGAGMGGLTAGALLARSGRSVLVVEAEDEPGGYTRCLPRGPYTFDRADHLIWGCEQDGPFGPGVIDAVLRHLRVEDRCEFVRVADPVYQVRLPGLCLSVPAGRDAFLEAHLRPFPSDRAALGRLVQTSAEIYRESRQFPITPGVTDMARALRRFPALLRYRTATLREVVDTELADPRLKAAYCGLWSWLGQPPAEASFIMWSILLSAYIEDGAFCCRGGFQRLPDAVAAGLAQAGGELLLGTPVTRILVEHARVHGVELAGGQRVGARWVISNVDARDTFGGLVPAGDVPPRLRDRLRQGALSTTIFALYAATDLDAAALGAARDVLVTTGWDLDRSYREARAGRVTNLSMLVPTLTDPTLAPAGEQVVILMTIAPDQAGLGEDDDGRRADAVLGLAEQVLPGLRDHLVHLEPVDPTARPLLSPLHFMGPIYGWAGSPEHTATGRLPQRTPIRGLLLAGQWTRPGPGVASVVQSGIAAARIVLRKAAHAPVLPLGL